MEQLQQPQEEHMDAMAKISCDRQGVYPSASGLTT